MSAGDGRFDNPIITSSRGATRVIFGRTPSRSSGKPSKVDHSRFGIVFANDLAQQAINAKKPTPFPEGSILVREKPATKTDGPPELLAVMIKRERGFNPDAGDWLFLITDGAMTKVRLRKKKGECFSCHQSQSTTDFVYQLSAK